MGCERQQAMMATATLTEARTDQARSMRLRVAAAVGLLVTLSGILAGTTPLITDRIPLPTWGLGAVALLGLCLMAGAGVKLVQMKSIAGPRTVGLEEELSDDAWQTIARAFEGLRTGAIPVLMVPDSADQNTLAAFNQGNEAFQFLARRQKVIRAAIDDLREELHANHKYLTRSQVGLIGANSVAERLEDLDKRLAKIRSVV
jgi:hypothetical protein